MMIALKAATPQLPRTTAVADHVVAVDETDSTNALAVQMIGDGSLTLPDHQDGELAVAVVAADRQTAGRGRNGHKWVSQPGRCSTMSYAVRIPRAIATDESVNGWLQMIAGLVTLDALNGMIEEYGAAPNQPDCSLELKWPNDVFCHGLKLGGLLSEFASWRWIFLINVPLGIFAALGLGLALPYLLASWLPAFARALPRPGAWMQTLRRLLAFPMLATVVWLVWVLGQQTGIDGAAALLALLVALAMAVWALTLRGTARRLIAPLSIAACAWLAWAIGPKVIETAPAASSSASAATPDAHGWQPWRAGLAEELLATVRAGKKARVQ